MIDRRGGDDVMLLRQTIESRMAGEDGAAARLPAWLKLDRLPTRVWFARRLGVNRRHPVGMISLRSAARSKAPLQDATGGQRVFVRASLIRLRLDRSGRAPSLARHLAYIGRAGAGVEGEDARLFDGRGPAERPRDVAKAWGRDERYFRMLISPEHADRMADLKDYARDVMRRVGADVGEEDLAWIGACHHDTAHPHVHIVIRGRRRDGQDLIMPRNYMPRGMEARAQEAAQERLGGLSRTASEAAIWRSTRADAFTLLDRRLLDSATPDGFVSDPAGEPDAWGALRRARLAHLEALGLARREGRRFRLAPDLWRRLDALWVRLGDARAMNQRRIEAAVETRPLGRTPLDGRATCTGFLDKNGAHRFVFVRDPSGVERYARLRWDGAAISPGPWVRLERGEHSAQALVFGASKGLGQGLSL